jgi:hypothetical protein
MNNLLKAILGFAVALAAGWAQAAGDFEGEVDMTMTTNNGKTLPIQYFVKGHKARTMTSVTDKKMSYTGSAIYDWQTNQIIMLMDQQKMYMVNQVHPEKWHYDNNNKHFKVTDTGKSENILGRTAEEWDYTSDDDNGKVWLTPGIGNWWGSEMAAQADKLPPDQRALVNMVVSKKLFPMKWETDDKSGKVRNSAVVTKVEAKSLGDDMFEPPSDYKKFDMGNLFNGSNQSAGSNDSSKKTDALGDALKSKLPF